MAIKYEEIPQELVKIQAGIALIVSTNFLMDTESNLVYLEAKKWNDNHNDYDVMCVYYDDTYIDDNGKKSVRYLITEYACGEEPNGNVEYSVKEVKDFISFWAAM